MDNIFTTIGFFVVYIAFALGTFGILKCTLEIRQIESFVEKHSWMVLIIVILFLFILVIGIPMILLEWF